MRSTNLFTYIIILFILISCSKDDEMDTIDQSQFIGQWNITITPKNDVKSSEVHKGESEADHPSNAVTETISFFSKEDFNNHLEEHEFEFGENDLGGIVHFLVFRLTPVSNDELRISVFQRDSLTHTTGVEVSEMNLTKTKNNVFEGEGMVLYDIVTETAESDELYHVKMVKVNDSPAHTNKSASTIEKAQLSFTLCDIASSAVSFIAGNITGNAVRPMGSCWGRRNGGGYYMFGDRGPGSIFPVWTQTVYVPQEWSWCKVRKYGFSVKSKGETLGVTLLKEYIEHSPQSYSRNTFGIEDRNQVNTYVQDLYDKIGPFAISLGYSTRTGNLSIYVNVKNDNVSHSVVRNHALIKGLYNAMGVHVNDIYFFVGKNISDPWHLRRSPWPTSNYCNSALVFAYLIGTIDVQYD